MNRNSVPNRPGRIGTILAVLLSPVCSGAQVNAQSTDPLYTAAKTEKSVVVWAAGPARGYESAVQAFEQRFPGVTVSLTGGFSNVLNSRMEEQFRAQKIETDVAILQTIQDFIAWKSRGLLLNYKPDGFSQVSSKARDPDGAWIAIITSPIFYGYNTEHVRSQDVPKSAIDFLKARFTGKLITAYPADDDATLFAFTYIVQKYGWGYMDQYMKQKPKFIQGHLGVARSLGSGETFVSFDNTAGSTLAVQYEGGKVALAAPTDDFLPVFFIAEAILKDAPHPNAAKLLVSWLLSKEWQAQAQGYSSRDDVPAPAGLPSLSSYRLDNRYVEFLSGAEQLADLRKRFERYSGPVTNTGGVR
jgi:ABC-type Fe3+ transport system substrate-binding protein